MYDIYLKIPSSLFNCFFLSACCFVELQISPFDPSKKKKKKKVVLQEASEEVEKLAEKTENLSGTSKLERSDEP